MDVTAAWFDGTMPRGPAPAPVGFPGCLHCPYRDGSDPAVCLACFEQAGGNRLPPPSLRCGVCGRPGTAGRPCANPLCGRADRGWSAVFAVGVHTSSLRRAIAAYKYRGERWWAEVFAGLLAGYLGAHPTWFEEYDLIVPMPTYLGVGARRSWDPVGSIFAPLAALLGSAWECEERLVIKTAETPPMSGRSRRQRVRLAEGQLRAALVVPEPAQLSGRRVLVIDDVLTEGSSLREVAGAVRGAGAEEVAGLVLARREEAPAPEPDRLRRSPDSAAAPGGHPG